jgi:hypothetical protein
VQTPRGDRCRAFLIALCVALVTLAAPSSALLAQYWVLPNGTALRASVELEGSENFRFFEPGIIGERVPIAVSGVELTANGSSAPFEFSGASEIRFSRGNYTVSYETPLRESHFSAAFDSPYRVEVSLPPDLDVRHPLLGMVSPGGVVNTSPDGNKTITWNGTRSFELRFYDASQESLMYLFGNIWLMAAVVLLLPFALTWKRKR